MYHRVDNPEIETKYQYCIFCFFLSCVFLFSCTSIATIDTYETKNTSDVKYRDSTIFLSKYEIVNDNLVDSLKNAIELFNHNGGCFQDSNGYYFSLSFLLSALDSNLHIIIKVCGMSKLCSHINFPFDKGNVSEKIIGCTYVDNYLILISSYTFVPFSELYEYINKSNGLFEIAMNCNSDDNTIYTARTDSPFHHHEILMPLKSDTSYNPSYKPVYTVQKKIYNILRFMSNIEAQNFSWIECTPKDPENKRQESKCLKMIEELYDSLSFDSFSSNGKIIIYGKKYNAEGLSGNIFAEMKKLDNLLKEFRQQIINSSMSDDEIINNLLWEEITVQAGEVLKEWNQRDRNFDTRSGN
ncbi:MAG: hypothetical protein J6X58_06410 [Bacteroidales bacterium]|nr:hypothetical protein [Bacteroidales bacterium]